MEFNLIKRYQNLIEEYIIENNKNIFFILDENNSMNFVDNISKISTSSYKLIWVRLNVSSCRGDVLKQLMKFICEAFLDSQKIVDHYKEVSQCDDTDLEIHAFRMIKAIEDEIENIIFVIDNIDSYFAFIEEQEYLRLYNITSSAPHASFIFIGNIFHKPNNHYGKLFYNAFKQIDIKQINEKMIENILYISYSRKNSDLVDNVCSDLKNRNIPFHIDKSDLHYKSNIKEYMDKIGASDAVISFISKPYLESDNCMYELTSIFEHGDLEKRFFPVLINDQNYFDKTSQIEIIGYWEDKERELRDRMKSLAEEHKEKSSGDLANYQKYSKTALHILSYIEKYQVQMIKFKEPYDKNDINEFIDYINNNIQSRIKLKETKSMPLISQNGTININGDIQAPLNININR